MDEPKIIKLSARSIVTIEDLLGKAPAEKKEEEDTNES